MTDPNQPIDPKESVDSAAEEQVDVDATVVPEATAPGTTPGGDEGGDASFAPAQSEPESVLGENHPDTALAAERHVFTAKIRDSDNAGQRG